MEEEEMGMEEDLYGDSYGGGGYGGGYGGQSPRSRPSGTPESDALQTYAGALTSLAGQLDFSPLFSPTQEIVVESGPVLHREAEQAFAAGHHGLARELAFGHMTTEYEEAIQALKSVKYSPLLRRPVWNIRWGVSMFVRGEEGVLDPQPIREGATPSRRNLAGGGQGQEDYGDQMQDMEMRDQEMERQMQMEMERDMGDMGDMGDGRSAAAPKQSNLPVIPERKMLNDEARETLDKMLGLVVLVAGEEFEKRFRRGDYGAVLTTVSAPEPVEPSRNGVRPQSAPPTRPTMGTELNDALTDAAEPLPMWQPSIVYLGTGTPDEIFARAFGPGHRRDLALRRGPQARTH